MRVLPYSHSAGVITVTPINSPSPSEALLREPAFVGVFGSGSTQILNGDLNYEQMIDL